MNLYKNGNFQFWGRIPTRGPTEVKFLTAMRTHVPLGQAKFHMNRCNESPLRGENADFRPLSINEIPAGWQRKAWNLIGQGKSGKKTKI